MWAVGCIFGEALLKKPLFFSKNNANLLFEIMQILGSPTEQDIIDMGLKDKCVYEIMPMTGKGLGSVIKLDKDGLKLLSDMLIYSPKKRITPLEVMASHFFDDIRGYDICKLTENEKQ